jgi:hypothetical protein
MRLAHRGFFFGEITNERSFWKGLARGRCQGGRIVPAKAHGNLWAESRRHSHGDATTPL